VANSSVELHSQEGYDAFLQRKNIECLKNSAGNEIREFAALVDGMVYTAGPQVAERTPKKGKTTPNLASTLLQDLTEIPVFIDEVQRNSGLAIAWC